MPKHIFNEKNFNSLLILSFVSLILLNCSMLLIIFSVCIDGLSVKQTVKTLNSLGSFGNKLYVFC